MSHDLRSWLFARVFWADNVSEPSRLWSSFGRDEHEGLQGEITGISDTADTDVRKGIFSPHMAKNPLSLNQQVWKFHSLPFLTCFPKLEYFYWPVSMAFSSQTVLQWMCTPSVALLESECLCLLMEHSAVWITTSVWVFLKGDRHRGGWRLEHTGAGQVRERKEEG